MTAGSLLARGMLIGIVAGLLAFGFAKFVGEPQVDKAIAFESAMDAAKEAAAKDKGGEMAGMDMKTHDDAAQSGGHGHDHGMAGMDMGDEELFSRETQSGIGLFTGVMAYGIAFGGLFSLVFAYSYGRLGKMGARPLSAVIAALAFVTVVLVPALKYPPNPPSVGNPETIGLRTEVFFLMIVCSIVAMVGAVTVARRLIARHGIASAAIAGGAIFLVTMVIVQRLLPDINEVPKAFPAVVLWRFRVAALGIQVVMWGTIGLGFGWLVERAQQGALGAVRRVVT
jgi:hypothetical protein